MVPWQSGPLLPWYRGNLGRNSNVFLEGINTSYICCGGYINLVIVDYMVVLWVSLMP